MRRFDLRDELRATADRRKQPQAPGAAPAEMRGEGIKEIAARLATMFPGLPLDTVQAVLSELFRADANCTREQLADRATSALLEMSLADGAPQSVTSFDGVAFDPTTQVAHGNSFIQGTVVMIDAEAAQGPFAGPVVQGFLRDASNGDTAKNPSSMVIDLDEEANSDEDLDEQLAQLLGLPDEDLAPCARTLQGILERIVEDPENQKLRRLRIANAKFEATVGRHKAAVELLHLAGFVDDAGEGCEDNALAFFDDPKNSTSFARVRESVSSVVQELSERLPAVAVPRPATGGGAVSSTAKPITRTPATSTVFTARGSERQKQRRQQIAELTEQRLRDPRGYRERAAASGAAMRSVGGRIPKPSAAATASNAVPARRAQHFTMDDIERMRIADEIKNTPNYAEEYRRSAHANPAHDYSTLVARSYDFELIARQALDGTNAYRASKGLAPCRWDDRIARVAAQHAAQMASGAAPFNHDGFDQRAASFGFPYRGAAENLALNQGMHDVAKAAVDGWIKSPGHEKNLRGTYNLCGIGVARSSNGTFYLTQLFAMT